jgi:hypothetical protein
MKSKDRINLVLRELDGSIELSLEKSGNQLFSLSEANRKTPRVNGFNKPRANHQEILGFAEREKSAGAASSTQEALNSYIASQDRAIDAQVLLIRKAIRHLIISAESKAIAEQVKSSVIENLRHTSTSSALPKIPSPMAKCMKCNAFYSAMPSNSLCTQCDGVVRNELRGNTWFECQICEGTGYNARFSKPCSSCDQKGWLFIEAFKM